MSHKKQSTLIKDMGTGFTRLIARDVCEYCVRNGVDPYVEFISTELLSGEAYAKWTTDDVCAVIGAEMERAEQARKGGEDDDEMAELAKVIEMMDPLFISTAENGSTLYKIVDADNLVVEPCCPANVAAQVTQVIKHKLWAAGKTANKERTGHILDLYASNGTVHPAPKLWAQPNDPVFCLARAKILPDASVPFPRSKHFLDRTNDGEAVAAYIWGIYSGENLGRQCLYMSEEIGESGKSSFFRAISRLFGESITAALNWNLLSNSSHASAHFSGKKFVVIGDNKNPNILMSQAVKELSGDDLVMVNQKYEAVYSTYLECRLVVLSNMPVNITSERHNQSRTLWVTLEPLSVPVDPQWADSYDDEMPGFLAYAQRCYAERCPTNYAIEVNDAVKLAVSLRVEEYESKFGLTFDTLFLPDPAGKLSLADFNREMDTLKWHPHERQDFLLWIARNFFCGQMDKQRTNKGMHYRGLRLKTTKDRRTGPMGGFGDSDGPTFTTAGAGYDA